jgi:glutaredoxin 3
VPVVEIYSRTSCSYCWQAKRLLDSKGVAYREILIEFGSPEREAMIKRANGRFTVPQIFIDGRHIGGCSDLFALERAGQLDSLIAA